MTGINDSQLLIQRMNTFQKKDYYVSKSEQTDISEESIFLTEMSGE